MQPSPLENTHDKVTWGLACHNRPWTTHIVGGRQVWHAIISLVLHTQTNELMSGMTSSPLDSTHSRTRSGVACHHRLRTAHTDGRLWKWHAIMALGKHTKSDDVDLRLYTWSDDAYHHSSLTAHTVKRHHAWHAIMALRHQTWSEDVGVAWPPLP